MFCFSVFSVQLFNLLKSWVSPTTTNTYVEEVPLENIDFPFDIILCVRPGLNATALFDLGYRKASHFPIGRNWFNRSLTGWGGHDDKGNGLKSAKEVLDLVKPSWSKKLPVLNVTDLLQSGFELKLNMINWLDDCHILNLADVEWRKNDIMIFFNETALKNQLGKNNVTFQLQLQDKGLAANRMIEEHRFFSNGDTMTMKNSMPKYIVKIKKNVFVEEDPRKTCLNYPNAEFSSYAECDQQYMRDRIDKVAPRLNLTPPWLTRDLGEVTTEPVLVPFKVQVGNANFL